MALSLSVTPIYTNPFEPHFTIAVSGLSSVTGAATIQVIRDYGDGSTPQPVRGLDGLAVTTDSADGTDFEASFIKIQWAYTLTVYDANSAVLATQSVGGWTADVGRQTAIDFVPEATALIQSIQQPALNLGVIVNDFPTWSVPGAVLSTNKVLGRANPVVIADAFGGRTGQFILLQNEDLSQEGLAAYETLLTYNDTLLFQAFYASAGVRDLYFKVTDLAFERLTSAGTSESESENVILITVSFTEVDRPRTAGQVLVFDTWQDILDQFATWNAVLTGRVSWLDVLNRAEFP